MGIHLTIDLCWRSWSATWQKRRKIIRCQRQRRRLNNEHDEEERKDVSDDQSGRLDEQNWGLETKTSNYSSVVTTEAPPNQTRYTGTMTEQRQIQKLIDSDSDPVQLAFNLQSALPQCVLMSYENMFRPWKLPQSTTTF